MTADRTMLAVGLLPLAAGAFWLLLLRQPHPAAAFAETMESGALASERDAPELDQPHFLGVVVAGQDAELGAELAGQVVKVFVEPGARVRRGEPLLQLAALSVLGVEAMAHAQGLQDRSAERAAELALETALDKAERMEGASAAFPSGEVTGARADARKAEAELAKLRATHLVDRATLRRELARADKQIVRAPFDGVLAARWVDEGDFVSGGGAPLLRVVDDARFVRFAVPGTEHVRLALGHALQVQARPGAPLLDGVVTTLEPEIDAAAGVGFARARLDASSAQAAGLLPGSRVQVLAPQPKAASGTP